MMFLEWDKEFLPENRVILVFIAYFHRMIVFAQQLCLLVNQLMLFFNTFLIWGTHRIEIN